MARPIIKNAKILAGVAILENPFDETCKIEAMPAEEIEEREPGLQAESKALMPKILIPECDVLIVDEIGKNIAGSGMDPNITGTFGSPYASGGLKASVFVFWI